MSPDNSSRSRGAVLPDDLLILVALSLLASLVQAVLLCSSSMDALLLPPAPTRFFALVIQFIFAFYNPFSLRCDQNLQPPQVHFIVICACSFCQLDIFDRFFMAVNEKS